MKKLLNWFKELSSELKGGIIGISIPLACYFLAIFLTLLSETLFINNEFLYYFLSSVAFYLSLPIGIFQLLGWRFIWGDNSSNLSFLFGFLVFPFWFILGYIVGGVINKLKSYKKP